eukprot:TRINITY_DN57084_c0_g1_i1.p1 TRINITY_DN57084_c0_g1~~TRINITY_DN57084_c0_g1_i1.p1  ORF type:complete len:386 (+),score=105.09 TRINITY_DN57084_c0_g1_i1:79-1236(+)
MDRFFPLISYLRRRGGKKSGGCEDPLLPIPNGLYPLLPTPPQQTKLHSHNKLSSSPLPRKSSLQTPFQHKSSSEAEDGDPETDDNDDDAVQRVELSHALNCSSFQDAIPLQRVVGLVKVGEEMAEVRIICEYKAEGDCNGAAFFFPISRIGGVLSLWVTCNGVPLRGELIGYSTKAVGEEEAKEHRESVKEEEDEDTGKDEDDSVRDGSEEDKVKAVDDEDGEDGEDEDLFITPNVGVIKAKQTYEIVISYHCALLDRKEEIDVHARHVIHHSTFVFPLHACPRTPDEVMIQVNKKEWIRHVSCPTHHLLPLVTGKNALVRIRRESLTGRVIALVIDTGPKIEPACADSLTIAIIIGFICLVVYLYYDYKVTLNDNRKSDGEGLH